MRRLLAAAAVLAVLALLGGCGSDDDASDSGSGVSADDLDGNTFVSTEVTGHDLVEGSTIDMSFEDGQLVVIAGCNTQSGSYEIADGDKLTWTEPVASTMMACSPELTEQDHWLHEQLTEGVTASLDGSTLTLTAVDLDIVLEAK